jgi:hypothetical protein
MSEKGVWDGLPGADLMEQGLADLRARRITEHALLVLVGEPRLRALDIAFPEYRPSFNGPIEHAFYDLLEEKYDRDAYSRYNSMLRRMASFAHGLEREQSKARGTAPHQI